MKTIILTLATALLAVSWIHAQPDTVPGSSLHFEDTNQYVGFGDPVTISGVSAITVEMWIKPGSFNLNARVIEKEDEWYLYQGAQGDKDIRWTIHGDGSNYVSTGALTAGEWYHLAATYDGATYSIHLNGELKASRAYATGIPNSAHPLTLAARRSAGGSATNFLRGSIDELRIWNEARTVHELRETMHHALTGAEEELVGYWQFNEGSGTTLTDVVGGNHGTLVNVPLWEVSSIPVGGNGPASSAINFAGGTLGNINITLSDAFDNQVDVYVSEIPQQPNEYPSDGDNFQGQRYWVVSIFGNPGTFSANLTFTYPSGEIDQAGSLGNFLLQTRGQTSDVEWIVRVHGASGRSETSISFAGITSFSQLAVDLLDDPMIYHVRSSGDDNNSGTSWASAFKTLQKALDASQLFDEIRVSAGTYYPTNDYGLDIGNEGKHFRMKNGVAIYGGFPSSGDPGMSERDWTLHETILSGDIDQSGSPSGNSYTVFYHPSELALNNTALLDGFAITGGNSNNSGGGMYNESCSPRISNCTFTQNSAFYSGGGMYNFQSNPEITDCTFFSNSTDDSNGGGMVNQESHPIITNTKFRKNDARREGGGMYNQASNPLIVNCVFSQNIARNNGGGMFNFQSNPVITNSVFAQNRLVTTFAGGGMYNHESSPIITNCIFSNNEQDAMLNNQNSDPIIKNSIFWFSVNIIIANFNGSTPVVSYSDVMGSGGSSSWNNDIGTNGGGNIDVDPLFVDPRSVFDEITEGNYRLQSASPAINAGTNGSVATTQDSDGNSRIVAGTVDMGAYEFQSALYSVAQEVTENGPTTYEFGNTKVNLEFNGIPADNTLYLFVDYYDSPADNVAFSDTPPLNPSVYRWVITKTGDGFTDASVTFTDVTSLLGVANPSSVTIYARPIPGSGDFLALSTSLDAEDLSTTVTSFSEFILGSDDDVLPVQMSSFTASASRLNAELKWRTESEVENHGFEVERRVVSGPETFNLPPEADPPSAEKPETTWLTVGFIPGAGTSSSPRDYSFVDKPDQPGRYAYRIKQIDHSGAFTYTSALEVNIGLAPMEFNLAQNYPNPFNPTTTIEFTLPQDGRVVLKIYDLQGREVATLVDEERHAGVYHQVLFDASRLASGLYFSRLQSGGLQSVKKIVLLK